jgi:epoxyqueuosine reductase
MTNQSAAGGLELTRALKQHVLGAGIDLVGVTSAESLPERPDVYRHVQARELLPAARAVVVAGFCVCYEPRLRPSVPGVPRGRFTPYGSRAFKQMDRHCRDTVQNFLQTKGHTAVEAPRLPIKPAAVRAGLGVYGRHAVVVTPQLGAWVMFSCFVTDAPLAVEDAPLYAPAPCPPECRRCREACPTGAITEDYQVNRARCITNWLWGYFAPPELRGKQENRLFGCGECLLACPRNKCVPPRRDYPVPIDEMVDSPDLIPLVTADEAFFRSNIPAFAMEAGVDAIRGNVIIALGNSCDPAAVDALESTLRHEKAQLRGYSAWALGRLGGAKARRMLDEALVRETDGGVIREIETAIREIARGTGPEA